MKSDVANKEHAINKQGNIKRLLFYYRVILLITGFMGMMILLRRRGDPLIAGMLLTGIAFYIYFSLIIVHAEMRYLLVPDMLISVFGSLPVVYFVRRSSYFISKLLQSVNAK